MRRLLVSLSAVALVSGFIAVPAAHAQQSANFYVGGFNLHAMDARPDSDIFVQNNNFLSTLNSPRGIDLGDFNHVTFGGEWLVGLVRNVEGSLGIGFFQSSEPTVYTDLVNINGTEITQTLKLRIVPFTATVRFLPMGTDQVVQPYIGGGVGVNWWRYSETGQFVDFQNNVFNGNFVGSGTATGPVVLGGVRFLAQSATAGFEIRYQSAEGDLPLDQGFAGTTVDLGGFNYLFTIGFRF